MNNQIEKMPELKDIYESVLRYNTLHKDGCFIFRFVGFKKDPTHKCCDCGDDCDEYDDVKSLIGAYGDLETLRTILNELRDTVEDEMDENGFVNLNEFGQESE